ncbi:hypothetical protein [Lysinibacillus sp. NPDC096259]|uniref:hypothetical protein n=1 Tax=Lysinibacillus sp. NPDC096259 TaxID=3390583 RepID=UPI003D063366
MEISNSEPKAKTITSCNNAFVTNILSLRFHAKNILLLPLRFRAKNILLLPLRFRAKNILPLPLRFRAKNICCPKRTIGRSREACSARKGGAQSNGNNAKSR